LVKKALIGDITDIDIRLLRIFDAVVRSGGFAAAELDLNIGRSTVSRHIADLEERLGFVLCRRGRSGFGLTPEGEDFHGAARRLLASIDSFRSDVHSLQGELSGSLKLALFDKTVSNPQARIAQAVRLFRKQAPEAVLEVAVGTVSAIEAGVLDGRFDVGVAPDHRRSEALRYFELFDERMELYCGRQHPLFDAAAGSVTLADLQDYDYAGLGFHSPNMEATHRFGLRRRASVTDQEAVATLVLSGCFIGFLPDHYAASFVREGSMRPLSVAGCSYDVKFMALMRRSPEPPRIAQAFMDLLRSAHQRP
jgi:DNA-binding transcriptional LysR family regulator